MWRSKRIAGRRSFRNPNPWVSTDSTVHTSAGLTPKTSVTLVMPASEIGSEAPLKFVICWSSDREPVYALLTPDRRAGVDHRNEAVARFRRRRPAVVRHQLAIQRGHELLYLRLHVAHLLAHVQDDFDARKIHAEVARQVQNHFEPLQVLRRVEPRIAVAARGF